MSRRGSRAGRVLAQHRMPGHLVRRLHQISTAVFADEMSGIGIDLTPVQYSALAAIAEVPRLDQATLAALIGYDRATIGGVVDRLEAKALVQRTFAAEDRRVRQLTVTAEGRVLLTHVAAAVKRAQTRMLAPLAERERAELLRLLAKAVVDTEPAGA